MLQEHCPVTANLHFLQTWLLGHSIWYTLFSYSKYSVIFYFHMDDGIHHGRHHSHQNWSVSIYWSEVAISWVDPNPSCKKKPKRAASLSSWSQGCRLFLHLLVVKPYLQCQVWKCNKEKTILVTSGQCCISRFLKNVFSVSQNKPLWHLQKRNIFIDSVVTMH